MNIPELRTGACLSLDKLKARLTNMPFLEYAARVYGYHVRLVEESVFQDLITFLGNESLRQSSWQLSHLSFHTKSELAQELIDSMPRNASTLHVVCYWGFSAVLREILQAPSW
jgi:hypothetical protein